MPKIVPDVRNRILDAVSNGVETEGWKALSLRTLASRCGIAVGTIYNYFPTKEAVLAAAIGRDWAGVLRSTRAAFRDGRPMDNLGTLYAALRDFRKVYRRVWAEMPTGSGPAGAPAGDAYRLAFRTELEALVGEAVAGSASAGSASAGSANAGANASRADGMTIRFVARAILEWSADRDVGFGDLAPVVARILRDDPDEREGESS